jgi:hypothetical protein
MDDALESSLQGPLRQRDGYGCQSLGGRDWLDLGLALISTMLVSRRAFSVISLQRTSALAGQGNSGGSDSKLLESFSQGQKSYPDDLETLMMLKDR